MRPRNIFASSAAHPPHINHRIAFASIILELVQSARYMAVTIVATEVVHSASVGFVCLNDALVVAVQLLTSNIQLNILVTLTEGEIVNRNKVGPSKVMDDAIRSTDPGVPDTGKQPRYHGNRRPSDADWKSFPLRLNSSCCFFSLE
jgi:hypothetical protein